jgi:hypothetical protein
MPNQIWQHSGAAHRRSDYEESMRKLDELRESKEKERQDQEKEKATKLEALLQETEQQERERQRQLQQKIEEESRREREREAHEEEEKQKLEHEKIEKEKLQKEKEMRENEASKQIKETAKTEKQAAGRNQGQDAAPADSGPLLSPRLRHVPHKSSSKEDVKPKEKQFSSPTLNKSAVCILISVNFMWMCTIEVVCPAPMAIIIREV